MVYCILQRTTNITSRTSATERRGAASTRIGGLGRAAPPTGPALPSAGASGPAASCRPSPPAGCSGPEQPDTCKRRSQAEKSTEPPLGSHPVSAPPPPGGRGLRSRHPRRLAGRDRAGGAWHLRRYRHESDGQNGPDARCDTHAGKTRRRGGNGETRE